MIKQQHMKTLKTLLLILLPLTVVSQQTTKGKWVDIFEEQVDSLLPQHLNTKDSISIYFGFDIIHIIPCRKLNKLFYYDMYCEDCDYPIGIFTAADVKSFIYWVRQFPPDEDNHYKNMYYQDIIEEKIWD